MRGEELERIFPAFQEIQDETLRVKSEEAMLAAMEAGGWDEQTIKLCPVTLNWENCDVSWTEHVSDVTSMCLMEFMEWASAGIWWQPVRCFTISES